MIMKISYAVAASSAILLLVFALYRANESARQATCESYMKQVAGAMLAYYRDYGDLPPPFTTDSDGQRMHSWRALVLPYLYPDLAKRYDFDQPWNSAHNQLLKHAMPTVLGCGRTESGTTTFLVPVGPTFLFSSSGSRRPKEGAWSEVVMIYNFDESTLNWLSPFDDQVDPLSAVRRMNTDGEIVLVAHALGNVSRILPSLSDAEVRGRFELPRRDEASTE